MRTIHFLGIVAAFAVAIGSIGLLASQRPGMVATSVAHAQLSESGCSATITRTLSSDAIRTCDSCGAELVVRPHCPPEPLNVVLVLVGYANSFSSLPRDSQRWTEEAIDALAMSDNPHVQVGVVYVRRRATIRSGLTNKEGDVRRASRVVRVNAGEEPGDWPCYSCGFEQAVRVLGEADRKHSVIVFIGIMIDWPLVAIDDDKYYRDFVKGARKAKGAADTLIIGCPNPVRCTEVAGFPWYREASPGYYFEVPGPGPFANAVEGLVPGPSPVTVKSLVV